MAGNNINGEIRALVESRCDRREYAALASLLLVWIGNAGLTDGLEELAKALRSTAGNHSLPAGERSTLKRLWVELDTILRNR